MKQFSFALIFSLTLGLFFSFLYPSSFAGESKTATGSSQIMILTPRPGEILPSDNEVLLTYKLVHGLGDSGDHVHVYLDGEDEGTTKRSPRSLGKLAPGKHSILLKVSNREHDPVPVEASVEFEVASPQPSSK